ncbi:Protein kinase C [Paramicrosporidium saccamoebae]|uniref:Protein kinase C n=1 Tax=Paramicrosporidium saccamoebae TaxID=1246581 RepID=A0A2H9TNL2_9FUNG|nr:Protein kinase C [Paramicrosporidium saccamoebae]
MPVAPEITVGENHDQIDSDLQSRLKDELTKKLTGMQDQLVAITKIEEFESRSSISESLAKELTRQISFVKDEIQFLEGNGHWVVDEKLVFERAQFRVRQLRDRLRTEQRLSHALLSTSPIEPSSDDRLRDTQKWKSTERNWQILMAQSKEELIEMGLKNYRYCVPEELVTEGSYANSPVTGKLRLQVLSVDTPDEKTESLMMQAIIDSVASEPRKFKRKVPCDLGISGIELDCNQAQTFELLVFDKSAKLLGFVFFKLSWLEQFLDHKGFSRTFHERLELVPKGSIELSIRLMPVSPNTLETPGIMRQQVIKRKVVKRMGHRFINQGQGALLLRCSHCTDLIYTSSSSFCQNCAKAAYVRCIADPNFQEWEEVTTALREAGREHSLVNVSVKTPCFCAHCGHLIPIMAHIDECYECSGINGSEAHYRLWNLFALSM